MSLDYKEGLIEREEAERKFIEAYKMGRISDTELIREYPKYEGIIKAKDEKFERLMKRQEDMMREFKNEIRNEVTLKLEDKREPSSFLKNPFLKQGLELLISHQATLLELPFINMLPAGYLAAKIVPIDSFAKKFKLSKTSTLVIKFILTLALTNYLYAFNSAIQVGKSSIPNLVVIAKKLSTNLLDTVATGGILQFNNIKGLTNLQYATITGKLLKEFQKLSLTVLGNGLALSLIQNSITKQDDIFNELKKQDDDDWFNNNVVKTYNNLWSKVKEPKNIEDQIFKSPTILYTDDQLRQINNNMMTIEPIVTELVAFKESNTNIYGWGKAVGLLNNIPETLNDIKNQKIGSQVEEAVKNVLFNIDPEIAGHVNMETLSITAESINNQIETSCNLLASEGRKALYNAAEQYNWQTTFGLGQLPGINIAEIKPVNAFKQTQQINVDIVLGSIGLIYIFTLFYYAYSGLKKAYRYWKPSRDVVNFEVLPDQRIRRRKSKSKRSKRSKY